MTERVLVALINERQVGELREVNGLWAFQYSQDWLNSPQRFALSPKLPLDAAPLVDGASLRPVQWYFDNLLPEDAQRTLLAGDAKLNRADAFGLLAYYGAESAGSLTLLPPEASAQAPGELRLLTDTDLSARIQQLPKVPLTHAAIKHMSLAGAQHKLAVVSRDGKLFEPSGALPSTHILKPDHTGSDYPHSVINEWFVMRLAHRLGLAVPEVHRRYVPQPVYLVDRFDRLFDGSEWKRLHAIDACQLLGLAGTYKYVEGGMESLAAIANSCRSPAVVRTRLFSWLVFNVLTGNGDAHLKNLSFLVSAEGVQLASHYDLLSTACYDSPAFNRNAWPGQTELAWPILGVARFSDLNRALMLDAGAALGINKVTATRFFNLLRDRITGAAKELYDEVETENAALLKIRPELAATFAGELRCLRAITHNVINHMVAKLN
jgi:serine/threonine-protein kinase HipA